MGLSHLDIDFLRKMEVCMVKGLNKNNRQKDAWKKLDKTGMNDRIDAIFRHFSTYCTLGKKDNLPSVACNAMIVYFLDKKEVE